jgi:hypothetical protein
MRGSLTVWLLSRSNPATRSDDRHAYEDDDVYLRGTQVYEPELTEEEEEDTGLLDASGRKLYRRLVPPKKYPIGFNHIY